MRWTAETDILYFNSVLRIGADGALYWAPGFGTDHWTPVTTSRGRPLALSRQRRGTASFEPAPGGLRLVEEGGARHDLMVTLLDEHDRVVHAWDVESKTKLGGMVATPALVEGDPVVALGVAEQTPNEFLFEYMVLRLAQDGEIQASVTLDPDAAWATRPSPAFAWAPTDGSTSCDRTSTPG